MSRFATRSDDKGREYVVRVQSAPALDGGTALRRTERKVRGKRKADAVELFVASRIDRKVERSTEQRLERRAKRGR